MAEKKTYKTSDNRVYLLTDEQLSAVAKQCEQEGVTLYDVSEKKFIELKPKKSKANGTTEG